MDFGVYTTPETVLAAIQARISSSLGLEASRVYCSLVPDTDIVDDPTGDVFVTLDPSNFASVPSWTDGGGRVTKKFDLRLKISLWLRLDLDTWKYDEQFLKNQTLGVLARWLQLLDGLEQFAPLDPSAPPLTTRSLLTEPMRNLSFNVVGKNRLKGWGKVESVWSVQFLYAVTQ